MCFGAAIASQWNSLLSNGTYWKDPFDSGEQITILEMKVITVVDVCLLFNSHFWDFPPLRTHLVLPLHHNGSYCTPITPIGKCILTVAIQAN